jgi:hypothetical protein
MLNNAFSHIVLLVQNCKFNYLKSGRELKTIRVTDEVHKKLTQLLGKQMANTGKPQTYNDVIEALISRFAS